MRFPTRRDLAGKLERFRTDIGLWRRKRAYRGAHPAAGPARAAFVVGCQRSGTDMVLWTLDRCMEVDRFDEDHRAAFRDCRIRDAGVRSRLIGRSRAARVLFKPVCDSHRTRALLDSHERAQGIWVYRDYRDLANSAVQRWGDMNRRFILQLAEGGGDWGRRQWNRELVTGEMQAELKRLVSPDINAHTAAAVFWYLVNRTYFDQCLSSDERCTIARYEDLVTEPKREFRRLCSFLEIAFCDEMVADIFASSVRRTSTEPISPAVTEVCEGMLARLDAALPEAMAHAS